MIVLLPVKQYHEAKSRLSFILRDHERESLAEALFQDTLETIQSVCGLEVIVCTAEKKVMRTANERGVQVFTHKQNCGLNTALTEAVSALDSDLNRDVAIIPADLPYLRKTDISDFANIDTPALAPDTYGTGTNGLKFRLGAPPHFQYGLNSALYHARALGPKVQNLESSGFSFDLDTPEDFNSLALDKCGPHLVEFLCQNRIAA